MQDAGGGVRSGEFDTNVAASTSPVPTAPNSSSSSSGGGTVHGDSNNGGNEQHSKGNEEEDGGDDEDLDQFLDSLMPRPS